MAEPKIILWDIETTHNIAAVFRMFDEVTNHENLLKERYIVCAAWKELGSKEVHAVSVLNDAKRFAKDPTDDYHVVKKLHDVLSEADVIIAHNGDQYDIKFAETRMLYHGLSPLPPIQSIDTLKVAKARFQFNSNKLDYIAKFLGLGRKIKTDNELWLKVLKGEKAAIREMVTYNKFDVVLLEKVFLKLRAYTANHVNRQLFGDFSGCPRCGSKHVQSRGTHKAISRTYRRYQCQDCGGWYREVMKTAATAKSRIL